MRNDSHEWYYNEQGDMEHNANSHTRHESCINDGFVSKMYKDALDYDDDDEWEFKEKQKILQHVEETDSVNSDKNF
jgi:hypothetical protein